MVPTAPWVLLAYRLPREPSTPRIALWRKLRRLGAIQLLDGLVGLPCDARNREQLEWLADEVVQAGGEASVWVAEPTTADQRRALERRAREAAAADYRAIREAAREAETEEGHARRRVVARLRREFERVRRRDYFRPPEREEAERALAELVSAVERGVAR